MAYTSVNAKSVAPANYADPGTGEICILALIAPTLGQPNAAVIVTDQPVDTGIPRQQKLLLRVSTGGFLSFNWVDTSDALNHVYENIDGTGTVLSSGMQLVGLRGSYLTNTWEIWVQGQWRTAVNAGPGSGSAVTTTFDNPLVFMNNGAGTLPFVGTFYWCAMWNSVASLSLSEVQAMAGSGGVYRHPSRYGSATRTHMVDAKTAASLILDRATGQTYTLSGTGAESSTPGNVEYMATLSPTISKDCQIISSAATTNVNGTFHVLDGISSAKRRILTSFGDISAIPAGSTITSAILTLECSVVTVAAADAFSSHPITRFGWGEGTATWNTYDGSNNWTTAGGDFEATNGKTSGFALPLTTGSKTYDIATTIQWILDHNPTTCDFILKVDNEAAGTGNVRFLSNTGATPPTLVITYTPPAAASGADLTLGGAASCASSCR